MSEKDDIQRRIERDDAIEAWWYGLESEQRQCTNCNAYIGLIEAGGHFEGQCQDEKNLRLVVEGLPLGKVIEALVEMTRQKETAERALDFSKQWHAYNLNAHDDVIRCMARDVLEDIERIERGGDPENYDESPHPHAPPPATR